MAESIPSWLNETFLASAFQGKNTDVKVEILKYSASPAVEAGNNYLSHLYRVPVEYKEGTEKKFTSLIIKVPIESGIIVEMAQGSGFLEKEPTVYKELLPLMSDKINYQLGPESFYCTLKNGMILTDLKSEGYTMCDRFKQLDFEHCEKVVVNIAKFHAASVACYHDNPDLVRSVGKEAIYGENAPFSEEENKAWVNSWVDNILEIVDKEENCKLSANYLNGKRKELANMKLVKQMFKSKEIGLSVLNHGDLWSNNIMFKHDDAGKVLDVKFVDYQITRYASPALDLIYFIWTSANEDVRESKIKSLTNTYLKTLNKTLDMLECEERMTEKELEDDLKARVNYGFIIMLQVLPMIMCEVENVINMEEVSLEDVKGGGAEEKFKKVYEGRHYKALVPKMLRQLHTWATSIEQ